MSPLIDTWRFRLTLRAKAVALPFLIARKPLGAILAIADDITSADFKNLSPEWVVASVVRVTKRPWLMRNRRCLRQGILAYMFLRRAGYQPELHFGIVDQSLGQNTLEAHCWVVLAGSVLLNPPSDTMTTIFQLNAQQRDAAKPEL